MTLRPRKSGLSLGRGKTASNVQDNNVGRAGARSRGGLNQSNGYATNLNARGRGRVPKDDANKNENLELDNQSSNDDVMVSSHKKRDRNLSNETNLNLDNDDTNNNTNKISSSKIFALRGSPSNFASAAISLIKVNGQTVVSKIRKSLETYKNKKSSSEFEENVINENNNDNNNSMSLDDSVFESNNDEVGLNMSEKNHYEQLDDIIIDDENIIEDMNVNSEQIDDDENKSAVPIEHSNAVSFIGHTKLKKDNGESLWKNIFLKVNKKIK